MQVFRDQLSEIDRDTARGLLDPEDQAQTRLEISRRILAADKRAARVTFSTEPPRGLTLSLLFGTAVLMIGGALAIYANLGAGGAPDQPLALRHAALVKAQRDRPDQKQAEKRAGDLSGIVEKPDAHYLELIKQLRATVAQRPNDVNGFKLLVKNEARLGNFAAAYTAKSRVIELLGDQVKASDFTDFAELLIIAAGGYVSPKAEDALKTALSIDANDGRARYYSGLDLAQNGRADLAFEVWSALLEAGPENAPWIAPIRAQIADVARLAGRQAPVAVPGPDQQQIKDAAKLSDADRQTMIKGMVSKLSDKLQTEGGPVESWARLIRSYGVLGETEKAKQAFEKAQAAFGNDAGAQALLKTTAADAGIAE